MGNLRIVQWIKSHKLVTLLLLIILFPFFSGILDSTNGTEISSLSLPKIGSSSRSMSAPAMGPSYDSAVSNSYRGGGGGMAEIAPMPIVPPINNSQVTGGMVMKSSNLSLLVSDVKQEADKVKSQAEALGGFMIESSFSNPGEAPNASITVRVPSASLDKYLAGLRSQAIRVTSENLEGYDISDQYTDIQKRLDTLNKTRVKFEAIYDKAVEIQDILNVQSQLIQNQNEIDQLKGQVQYMEKSVQLAKVTVYLSTDELALPYDSDSSWRPGVVFKEAVRSLVSALHQLLNFVIWVIVFGVIWIPVLLIIIYIKRLRRKKSSVK